jgi:hypothetical protein
MIDRWLPTYDHLVYVPVWSRPTFDGVRAVDPGFQQQIDVLLEGMINARGLNPLRLDPERHDHWGQDILETLLPELEPTLPLFTDNEEEQSDA